MNYEAIMREDEKLTGKTGQVFANAVYLASNVIFMPEDWEDTYKNYLARANALRRHAQKVLQNDKDLGDNARRDLEIVAEVWDIQSKKLNSMGLEFK